MQCGGGGKHFSFRHSVIPSFRDSDFISAQYLENKLMQFDQILYMYWYWQYLDWYYYASIFANLQQSCGPWSMSEFRFCSIPCERIDGMWPNFAYAFILGRSKKRLLQVYFRKFVTELWPLCDVIISFPLNILRTTKWILTIFCLCIDTDNI